SEWTFPQTATRRPSGQEVSSWFPQQSEIFSGIELEALYTPALRASIVAGNTYADWVDRANYASHDGLSVKLQLQWSPDFGCGGGVHESDQPGLFIAIQEQLGLKLEATKGPVEVLVID